ncbi:MAG: T9SS type A sorting domain-containing protein, partial [Bacteroidetes bacterium]|nr:T9SS type A sorting domain-containing protein [Bacteroidota bacterium]
FWVGSNGYLGFTNGQISAPFNSIPNVSGAQNFLAAMACDLLFDVSNAAECWRYVNPTNDTLIVSWINVPFYDAVTPAGAGNNTFQIILSAVDSSITYQYQVQSGVPAAGTNVVIGIENNSGSIGLQHSMNVFPPVNYAIKYYYPSNTTYVVNDASTSYNDNTETGGLFRSRNGSPFTMKTSVKNTGNQNLASYNVFSRVLNAGGGTVVSDNKMTIASTPGQTENITMTNTFNPTIAGTFRYVTNTQLPGDATPSNDQKVQEIVVLDTTVTAIRLSYDNGVEAGLGGLNWTGGSGGAAIYFVPPFYPAKVTDLYTYIVANPMSFGYSMVVYDDNGSGGAAGTKIDSIYVTAGSIFTSSWNNIVLPTPITVNSGGLYVAWKMNGDGLTLGQNQVPPFSNRTFEILGSTWATYRYRETEDLMINIGIEKIPVSGAGINEGALANYFGDFYPNPSSDLATINYDIPFNVKNIFYQLYDIQGRIVKLSSSDLSRNNGKLSINVAALDAGIYSCKISVDGQTLTKKLVITK